MKNHHSDFETPFGSIVKLPSGKGVLASCSRCQWTKETKDNRRKRWSTASRARMGLQLHAISIHMGIPNDPRS